MQKWFSFTGVYLLTTVTTAAGVTLADTQAVDVNWGLATLPSPYTSPQTVLLSAWFRTNPFGVFGQNHGRVGLSNYELLPAGYFGVATGGLRDGALCGESGWVFNTSPSNGPGTGGYYCTNPPGNQSFQTVMQGAIWNGSSYTVRGLQASPAETN